MAAEADRNTEPDPEGPAMDQSSSLRSSLRPLQIPTKPGVRGVDNLCERVKREQGGERCDECCGWR